MLNNISSSSGSWWQRFFHWIWRKKLETQVEPEISTPEPEPAPREPEPEPKPEPQPEFTQEESKRKHKEHDYTNYYLRRDISDTVNSILDTLENLTARGAWDIEVQMRCLEELWGCDFLLLDREIGERMKGGDQWSAVESKGNEAELAEILWPVDYATVKPMEGGVELFRIKSVTAKEVRGQGLIIVTKKILHYWIAQLRYDANSWEAVDGYLGLVNDKWVILRDIPMAKKHRLDRHETVARIMASMLTARYEWHVALGTIPGGPRVLLPTNPSGCLQLFKNRDKVGNRRDSLKHWVLEHWRDHTEHGLAFVCNHLRGNTKFRWSDFNCELFVSAFDLEKNEYFKTQAKEWRSQRKHNRAKVHLKRTKRP